MATPTGARHALYNRLVEVLDPEPAETLMSYLPLTTTDHLATKDDMMLVKDDVMLVKDDVMLVKDDMMVLKHDLTVVKDELRGDIAAVRADGEAFRTAMEARLDRLVSIMMTGLFGIVTTIVAFFLATLIST